MSQGPVRPFLISKNEDGEFKLTVRDTHYNSQDYPIVTSYLQHETFKSAAAARSFAQEKFKAKAGEFAMK